MYESGEIIKYLFENYSDGQTKPPWGLMLGPLTAISCTLGMLPRVSLQPRPNAVSLGSWLHLWAGPAALGTPIASTGLSAAPVCWAHSPGHPECLHRALSCTPCKWDCSLGSVLCPVSVIIGPAALCTQLGSQPSPDAVPLGC